MHDRCGARYLLYHEHLGNEGLIGTALFMGGETNPSWAIVQSAGHAYRLIRQQLKEEFHRNGKLQLLLRYTRP